MSECLVTKLKSSVNNDNLSKLGQLRFRVHIPTDYDTSQSGYYFRADPLSGSGKKITVELEGNSYFMTSRTNQTSKGKILVTEGPVELYPKPGDFDIIIKNHYDLGWISIHFHSLSGGVCTNQMLEGGGIESFNHCNDLKYIHLPINATMEQIGKLPSLTTFPFIKGNITGTLTDLTISNVSWENLTTMLERTDTVCGDYCNMAASMWEKGRRNGTCKFILNSFTKIGTFQEPQYGYVAQMNFSDSGVTIKKNNNTILVCSYDGISKQWS